MLRTITRTFGNAVKLRTFFRMGVKKRNIGIHTQYSKNLAGFSLASPLFNRQSRIIPNQSTLCQRLSQNTTNNSLSSRSFMTICDKFPIEPSTTQFRPMHRNFGLDNQQILNRTLYRVLRRYIKNPEVFPPDIVLKELQRQGLPTLCLDEKSAPALLRWSFSQEIESVKQFDKGINRAFDVIRFVEKVHHGRYSSNIPSELPVFQYQHPLLPGTPLELHILEPRYLEMVNQVLNGPKVELHGSKLGKKITKGKGPYRFVYIYHHEDVEDVSDFEDFENEPEEHDEFNEEQNDSTPDMTGQIGVIMHVESFKRKSDGQINLKTRAGSRVRVLSQRTSYVGSDKPLLHFKFDVITDNSNCEKSINNLSLECLDLLKDLYERGGVKFREALESYLGIAPLARSNPEAFSFWLSSWLLDRKGQQFSLSTTSTLDRLKKCREMLNTVLEQHAAQKN